MRATSALHNVSLLQKSTSTVSINNTTKTRTQKKTSNIFLLKKNQRHRKEKFILHAAGNNKNASSSSSSSSISSSSSRDEEMSEEELKSKNQLFGKEVDDVSSLNDEVKSLAVSSEETQVLNREHHIEGFVAISDSGRSGARKVLLTHPSGATCEIYTKGASVASWTLPNGGEVLFTPDFSDFKTEAPKDAGLSYNFPHWDGFDLHRMRNSKNGEDEEDFNIRQMNFDILDTGIRELWNPEDNTYTANPYVTIYTTDDDQSRKKWNDNAFQVTLTFTLEFDALNISHSVENKNNNTNSNNNNVENGESSSTSSNNNNVGSTTDESSNLDFEYASGYRGHVRVADLTAVPPRAYYLGLDDCVYFDMTDTEETGGDPQVKFTKDLDEYEEKCFTLKEKTERVYANVKRDSTMLEIGTGSSVVIEDYDRFAIGYDYPDEETAMKQTGNWHDRAVFSYWKSKEKKNDESYRWFSGLGFGNITKLVKLKAGQTQTHTARLVVRDATLSENIIKERDAKRSYEAVEREFSKREGYNMEGSDLPTDFQ
jgi:hypothetical protein